MMERPSAGDQGSESPQTSSTGVAPTSTLGPELKKSNSLNRLILFSLIAVAGLGWDLWTKHRVFSDLGCPQVLIPGPGVYPIWKGQLLGVAIQFQFETTFNYGALWGMGQGQSWLFASLSIVAIGVIVGFLWHGHITASMWLTVATGFLLAGTLGNLFDRLGLHGHRDPEGQLICAVRDFLDFWFFGTFHWATFNFADVYLVTGAIMLVVHSFFTPPPSAATNSTSPDSANKARV